MTLAKARSTCAPVRCIWEAQPAEVDICRSSERGWARSHRWQCRSFAEVGDRPRRNVGTSHPSLTCWAPCRHPSGCCSILNRSRTHLAVEQRNNGISVKRRESGVKKKRTLSVIKQAEDRKLILLALLSHDHYLFILLCLMVMSLSP